MSRDTARLLGAIQLILEVAIIIGFVLALVPFLYLWSSGWVIPLVIISFIFSLFLKNDTVFSTGLNIIMAILSFIPIVGYVPRIIAILISLYNISKIRRAM
ncbi:hypothetical protein [Paenibacillus sp. J2TS4]|uniref:hypothetical protein n=1 Tax=Paenibacillus sp. J2TS4 TaxID=2807194 RepID=UPI001B2792F8|nr:hypothetical protein [Paenibacillus sp. J2TS4]GIP35729.1 hypothetical protein J2TS4_49390 [Paenibacillus sp. J2TS4]